jgi:hypothetical protein
MAAIRQDSAELHILKMERGAPKYFPFVEVKDRGQLCSAERKNKREGEFIFEINIEKEPYKCIMTSHFFFFY